MSTYLSVLWQAISQQSLWRLVDELSVKVTVHRSDWRDTHSMGDLAIHRGCGGCQPMPSRDLTLLRPTGKHFMFLKIAKASRTEICIG